MIKFSQFDAKRRGSVLAIHTIQPFSVVHCIMVSKGRCPLTFEMDELEPMKKNW